MPDVLLAPYLVLSNVVTVGAWTLVPFRRLANGAERDEPPDRWVPDSFRVSVARLVDAYRVEGAPALGAIVVPPGGTVGDAFDRAEMRVLGHALLAGSVSDNPRMACAEDEQSPNGGHAVVTSENAVLYGHPLGGENSYAIETGVLARVIALRHAPAGEALPPVTAPVELPKPLFANFDDEVADAAYVLLTSDDTLARRFQRALDWYRIALSNAEAVTLGVRIGAARSAIEALTGRSDETKKIVRAYGELTRTDATTEQTYEDVFWSRGPVQLSPDEWWLTRLSELRNAIVHGDEVADALWQHEGHHQLDQVHDRLIAALKRVLATHAGDELLCLSISQRVFPRIAQEFGDRLREEQRRASGDQTHRG